jgi:hypothetical protein
MGFDTVSRVYAALGGEAGGGGGLMDCRLVFSATNTDP